jgi:hypothetical protein
MAPRIHADVKNMTPSYRAALAGIGVSILRMTARAYETAVKSGRGRLDGAGRDTAVRHAVLSLAPKELAALNREIDALIARYGAKKPAGPKAQEIALTLALTPRKPPSR